MGLEADGWVGFLDGGRPWAAAILFVLSVVAGLLVWKRVRSRGEVAGRHESVAQSTADGISLEPATSVAAPQTVCPASDEDEGGGRKGLRLVDLAPEEATDTTSGAESSGISAADSVEVGALVEAQAGGSTESVLDSDVFAPPVEAIDVTREAISGEETNIVESITMSAAAGERTGLAERGQVGEEGPSEAHYDGESEELAGPVEENKASAKRVERGSDTEESQETAEAGVIARESEEEPINESGASGEAEEGTDGESTPARYRAPRLGPGKAPRRKSSKSSVRDQEQILELRIRAVCDRHGFCRFQVVGRRPEGAPGELEARGGRRTIVLSEVADDWYEIAELEDLPEVMEGGLRFCASEGEGDEVTWELRGRDLYVLAELRGVSGFVSTSRLSISEKQIVVCRESRAKEVQTILAEAGCNGLQVRGRDFGAPSGWVFFGPVNPSRSIPQIPGDDILNVVRPIPDVEVRLDGGLWLRGSSWIAGYPPRIRVVGEMPSGTEVVIDGERATEHEEGIYATGSSASVGSHVVWCAGKSATYELCEWDVRWDEWKADGFARPVCGAAVVPSSAVQETLVSVPTSNPVLIGANAGEVFRCERRPGKRWSGLVPFAVCWALPEDALHCDRSLRWVLLVNPVPPVQTVWLPSGKKTARTSILLWCQAIRDCQQKGLAVAPADGACEELWRQYKQKAKAVWRTARREFRK